MRLNWGKLALRVSTSVAALGVVLASCSFPTDMCACPPARSTVFVVGTLVDANGAPISGGRLYLVGQSPRVEGQLLFASDLTATTDAGGAFSGRVFSLHSPGELVVRGLVITPTAGDTIVVEVGPAQFRHEAQRPDTLRVSIQIP